MSMKTTAFVLCKSRKVPRLSLNFCSVFPIEEQNCSFTSDLASQVNKNVFISLWDRIFTSHHGNIDDPMISMVLSSNQEGTLTQAPHFGPPSLKYSKSPLVRGTSQVWLCFLSRTL